MHISSSDMSQTESEMSVLLFSVMWKLRCAMLLCTFEYVSKLYFSPESTPLCVDLFK